MAQGLERMPMGAPSEGPAEDVAKHFAETAQYLRDTSPAVAERLERLTPAEMDELDTLLNKEGLSPRNFRYFSDDKLGLLKDWLHAESREERTQAARVLIEALNE